MEKIYCDKCREEIKKGLGISVTNKAFYHKKCFMGVLDEICGKGGGKRCFNKDGKSGLNNKLTR